MTATPLSVLLSHALVALTIEIDNEFEERLQATWARPFLTSVPMWANFLRYVAEGGSAVEDVAAQGCLTVAPLASIVGGMERWRYVEVDRPDAKGFGSARGVGPKTVVRPSITGELAQRLWATLPAEVEDRWRDRFGAGRVDGLARALAEVHDRVGLGLPRAMPPLSTKGLFAGPLVARRDEPVPGDRDLVTLLSGVLLALTLDYERGSNVSLPIAADVVRVLGPDPTPLADVPLAGGISKEAVSMSMTWLEKAGLVTVAPSPSGKGKVVSLTEAGVAARGEHGRRLSEVEAAFATPSLVDALESVVGHDDFGAGLAVPPGGWRATGRYKAQTKAFVGDPRGALPHAPMVLGRGGWPDGS